MKIIQYDYAFIPSTKKVLFENLFETDLKLADVFMITNLADNEIIYQPQIKNKGGSLEKTGDGVYTLTLDFDTTPMDAADELQIVLNITTGDELEEITSGISKAVTRTRAIKVEELLARILEELVKIENHLAVITDEDFDSFPGIK